jgi:hypothetical protein
MDILLLLVVIGILIALSVRVGGLKKEISELKWTVRSPQPSGAYPMPTASVQAAPVQPAPAARQSGPVGMSRPDPQVAFASASAVQAHYAPQPFIGSVDPWVEPGDDVRTPQVRTPQTAPQAAPQARTPQAAPREQKSIENWVGRNVLAIVAAILVFLGLVFLGILLVPHLTDPLKILLMFVLSTLLGVGGFLLTKKKKNVFSTVLLGTGCGSMFISILMTHLFFHALGDIAAFSLLLVWMAASLFIAKTTDSLLVSIIAHVGMVISLVFGFVGGLSDEKVLLLLGYQLASSVVIIVGNVLCSKKTYRFGLFVSLAMIVMVSLALWSRFFGTEAAFASSLSPVLISAAFIVQFVASTVLSYLLFVSIVQVKESSTQLILQALNKVFWLISLFLNVLLLSAKLYFVLTNPQSLYLGAGSNYGAVLVAVAVTIFCLFVHCAVTVILRKVRDLPRQLEMLSVGLLSAAAVFILAGNFLAMQFYEVALPQLLYLLPVAVLLAAIYLVGKNRFYWVFAAAVLVCELVFLVLFGFKELTDFGTIALSFAYLLVDLGLLIVLYWQLDDQWRTRGIVGIRLFSLIILELSIASILSGSTLTYRAPIAFLTLLALLLVAQYSPFEKTEKHANTLRMVVRINEFLVIYSAAIFIVTARSGLAFTILYFIVASLGLLILASRVYQTAKARREKGIIELFSAIGFTLTIVAFLYSNTSWLDVPYTMSMVIMFTALLCIALGFWSRIKAFRLYGLVVMMLCVIKLVTLDISNLDSLMRVVAFIVGGLFCFAISALYNYTVKRFNKA